MSDLASLQYILHEFVSHTPEVEGAAIVTPDGLPLAAALPKTMDEERTSAMSAAMLSLGERIGREFARGNVERIFVQGEKGYGVLTSCGSEAVLLTLASHEVKQGLLFLEIKRVSEKLASALV
ncbi:MAG: roadblock/LC7 domain-containing protein [Thermostichales cyanobacterium SRBZ-1_bins_19]